MAVESAEPSGVVEKIQTDSRPIWLNGTRIPVVLSGDNVEQLALGLWGCFR